MPYLAQPGTIPHRVIEWFKQQEAGTELPAAPICQALGIENTNSFSSWMTPARDAKLLHARTKPGNGRTLFWSLGDGAALPPAQHEPQGATAAEEPDEDVMEFDACMWGMTGDLIIYGARQTEDGGFVLSPKEQAVIKRLITWTPPA